jgi:outer membrane lipoprotein carrier protein
VRHPSVLLLSLVVGLASAGVRAQNPTPVPPAAPSGVIPPAASEALARAMTLYGDGAGHAASFTQIYTPSGFATAKRESGSVVIQVPQRVRFDYVAPEKKVFTYDAGEGRFFSPEDKQLTVRRLSEEEKARLPIVFLTQPSDLGRQYEIAVEPGEAPAPTRLLLTPRIPRPELAWLRLAIDAAGAVTGLSYQDSAGNRTEFRFEAWKTGKARPAADFRIMGPPGTRIVEN